MTAMAAASAASAAAAAAAMAEPEATTPTGGGGSSGVVAEPTNQRNRRRKKRKPEGGSPTLQVTLHRHGDVVRWVHPSSKPACPMTCSSVCGPGCYSRLRLCTHNSRNILPTMGKRIENTSNQM